jgi:hypothetical protein
VEGAWHLPRRPPRRASPEATGREVTFTGADILRTAGGKLAEYWANADSLLFFQQLGVREVPVQ